AFSPDKKSLLYLLLAILFWFMGWNAVETFFTLYAKSIWGIRESTAALYLGIGSVAFLLFAIPSGLLASKFGRKAVITSGIIWLSCVMTIMTILGIVSKAGIGPALIAMFVAAGIGWALINIHSFPMVVDMTTSAKTGAYTGLYYFFSALAAILAPPLFGLVRDIVGSMVPLFPFSAVFFLLALWSFSKVEAR
ncbi:MAG TPA: MFS transporter, partial [Bacillota bacterium]|nr:MFS transporter [Bacillota bacterium]